MFSDTSSSYLRTMTDDNRHEATPNRGDICHSRHCRQKRKIFARGVNFSIKQHIWSHNQHKKLCLLIYLCFFSLWTSSCLTKWCLNYWYLSIYAHNFVGEKVASSAFYWCKILGLKIRLCKNFDKYHVPRLPKRLFEDKWPFRLTSNGVLWCLREAVKKVLADFVR